MRKERITLAGRGLVIARPDDPESLIDESRFEEDEFLPYWAELWPTGLALARHVAGLGPRGKRVLELGCGLAVPSLAAALAGGDVLATDWAPEAVELVAVNAAANGLRVRGAVLDWTSGKLPSARFDVVVAADVLYEERNTAPLLRVLGETVAPDGHALVADPGRRHAATFFEQAQTAGWAAQRLAAVGLPAGWIAALDRRARTTG